MKAIFKNIGPIQEAKLELGDLTIIAGQNNTGKTYLVYTLYGFLKFANETEFHELLFHQHSAKLAKQLQQTRTASITISEYKKLVDQFLQGLSQFFSKQYIADVFSAPNGEFEDSQFELKIDNTDSGVEGSINARTGKKISLTSSPKGNNLVFELDAPDDQTVSVNVLVQGIQHLIHRRIILKYFKTFILSAERFGISLFYKELDFTKNRLVEELQKLSDKKSFNPFHFIEKESARYAKPIKDNIDYTRDLSDIQKQRSKLPVDEIRSVQKIMDGYYKVQNDEIRFISNRRGKNKFNVPLHLASSSARGVSDLYFYLKHIAESGQLLIIDEPESHLNPTNQILMARLLVFCVNAGLKVLITTHSDYLIKEINNLIMLNGEFEEKEKFLKDNKKEYTEGDYLNPEVVKAYICEEGTLKPCSIDEQGIDMPVFDDAIDKINKISNTLWWLKEPKS